MLDLQIKFSQYIEPEVVVTDPVSPVLTRPVNFPGAQPTKRALPLHTDGTVGDAGTREQGTSCSPVIWPNALQAASEKVPCGPK